MFKQQLGLAHLRVLKTALTGAVLSLCGCGLFDEAEVPESASTQDNYGALITDTQVVIDDFHFSEAACAELIPEGFANRPAPTQLPAPMLIVNSTACYRADVTVLDEAQAPVDSFSQVFGIWGQRNGDKERGHIGYLVWDPPDSLSHVTPHTYSWRIRMDFGEGRKLKFRALVDWPR